MGAKDRNGEMWTRRHVSAREQPFITVIGNWSGVALVQWRINIPLCDVTGFRPSDSDAALELHTWQGVCACATEKTASFFLGRGARAETRTDTPFHRENICELSSGIEFAVLGRNHLGRRETGSMGQRSPDTQQSSGWLWTSTSSGVNIVACRGGRGSITARSLKSSSIAPSSLSPGADILHSR